MPVNAEAVGRTFGPFTYKVEREKIREYAHAVGETNPLYLDLDAARDAGYADLVAPPMFAVVYSAPAIGAALQAPELEIDFEMLVHGGQELEWGPLVLAGDEIVTQMHFAKVYERLGMTFYVFASQSSNQRGAQVCRGTWTSIVRPRP